MFKNVFKDIIRKDDAREAADLWFNNYKSQTDFFFDGKRIKKVYKSMGIVLIDTDRRKRVRVEDFVTDKGVIKLP